MFTELVLLRILPLCSLIKVFDLTDPLFGGFNSFSVWLTDWSVSSTLSIFVSEEWNILLADECVEDGLEENDLELLEAWSVLVRSGVISMSPRFKEFISVRLFDFPSSCLVSMSPNP